MTRCDCHTLRRLEVLGRRQWPALPSATVQLPDESLTKSQTVASFAELARRGLRPRIRVMPRLGPATVASLHTDADEDRK